MRHQVLSGFDETHSGRRQLGIDLGNSRIQIRMGLAAQVQPHEHRIELVPGCHVLEHLLRLSMGLLRHGVLSTGSPFDVLDVALDLVLRCNRHRHRQHRSRRQSVKPRIGFVPDPAFCGEVPDARVSTKVLQREELHRLAIELEAALFLVARGLRKVQRLGKIPVINTLWTLITRIGRAAEQLGARAGPGHATVEEWKHPLVEVLAVGTPRRHAGFVQRGKQGCGHRLHLLLGHAALIDQVIKLAIDAAANTALLAAPGLARHQGVGEQPLLSGNLRQVTAELFQHGLRVFRVDDGLRAIGVLVLGQDVVVKVLVQPVDVSVIAQEELDHPRRRVDLGNRLDSLLNLAAVLLQVLQRLRLRSDSPQLEQRAQGLAVAHHKVAVFG